MTNEERPNWVEARANCTPEGTFEQIFNAIKHDVACFNKLDAHKRTVPTIKYERIGDMVHFGFDQPSGMHDGPIVTVRVQCEKIQVLRDHKIMFDIEREWNKKTLMCDLLINCEIYCLWQISQKAIYDLLFPEE